VAKDQSVAVVGLVASAGASDLASAISVNVTAGEDVSDHGLERRKVTAVKVLPNIRMDNGIRSI
jgi:hypothetical protein